MKKHNGEKVVGTDYRRKDIDKNNFDLFLKQYLNVRGSPADNFMTGSVSEFKNQKWNNKIYKFKLNETVFLSKKADWSDKSASSSFSKPSVHGSYGEKKYTVSRRLLRLTRKHKQYVQGKLNNINLPKSTNNVCSIFNFDIF